jgi:aminopeptidase N
MGDDAFFAALQTYALRYRHQLVTSQNFFRILDEFSQADISPLLEAYFGVVE